MRRRVGRGILRPSATMVSWILAGMVALAPESAPWWDAPETCPDVDAMTQRIDALVPDGERAPPRRVRIEEGETGFVATIEIDRDAGTETRTVEGESCEALADAVALVIAIGSSSPREPPREEPPIVEPAPAPTPIAPPRRATPAPTPSPRLRLAIFGAAGITWRTVPAIGPTIAGGLAILGRRWRTELAAIGTTPTREHLPAPHDDVRAEVASGVAAIRGAYVPRVRSIELPITGGVELGGASAISRGATNEQRRAGLLVALAAGAGLMWAPIPALALRIEVAGVLALARPRFAVHTPSGDAVAFEAPWLGLRAFAGIEGRIPVPRRLR
jgi:hypothetical protein